MHGEHGWVDSPTDSPSMKMDSATDTRHQALHVQARSHRDRRSPITSTATMVGIRVNPDIGVSLTCPQSR